MKLFHIIILNILFICFMIGCRYNKCYYCETKKITEEKKQELTPEQIAEIAKARQTKLGILRDQLKVTPLFEKWHHNIDQETIKHLYISDDVLFAETESNRLFAFDRITGIPMWVYLVGDPIDFQPEIHRNKLYLLSMGYLHILHKKTGEPDVKKELGFAPSSPLCPTDTNVYMGGWDSFLYAVNSQTGDRVWRHRIDGYVEARPTEKEGILFVAATDDKIYAINGQSGRRHAIERDKWAQDGYYTTRGANIASVSIRENPSLLYAGSRDYNLYCIDRIYGHLRWKFESGGEINRTPWIVGDLVYVSAEINEDNKLYLINGDTGRIKGEVKQGIDVFFIGKKHDWILRNDRKVAMITETGEVRNIFNLDFFDHFTTNVNLDKDRLGYVATTDGFIFAVEER